MKVLVIVVVVVIVAYLPTRVPLQQQHGPPKAHGLRFSARRPWPNSMRTRHSSVVELKSKTEAVSRRTPLVLTREGGNETTGTVTGII